MTRLPLRIAPIVEGQGDVAAVPILLRRIVAVVDAERPIEVQKPFRVKRDKVVQEGELERYLELACRRVGDGGRILVLLDADDDCPAELGPALGARAEAWRADRHVSVVLANHEFEAWFLAAALSLRGQRGLPDDLAPPADPDGVRDAKGWLQDRRTDRFAYGPTTDQPALAAVMDLGAARSNAPSFDKLWREVERLLA